ncbi:MAG TPA: outer membrane beta-barrel protein [Polyangia bacterium]|nr:outer membrane beta-barrel protein [Polyangia bacterium]
MAPPPPAAAPVVVAPAPAPAAAAPAGPSPKFTFGGLVDTYYLYNFTPPSGANSLQFPGPLLGVGRAFDTNANSFTLALAKLTMNASLDPVSFQLDMGYGSVGTIINNSIDGLPSMSAQTGNNFLIEQAYGEIALPGNLTLDFGKFTTTAGAEVIEANKNWLYSRSLLFNAIPLLHTGVRAGLKVSDQLSLQASVVNGWNNDPDFNAWKTIGLSASVTASPMLSGVITTYFGKEGQPQPATGATPGDLRFLLDLVVAATINSQFGLNLNVDYIKAFDDNAKDYQVGAALMGRYVVNDHFNVAARGEFLATHYDNVAMSGVSATVKQGEGTVMVGIDVGKNFELRPEVRADFAGEVMGAKILEGGAKSAAVTGEIAALTWF